MCNSTSVKRRINTLIILTTLALIVLFLISKASAVERHTHRASDIKGVLPAAVGNGVFAGLGSCSPSEYVVETTSLGVICSTIGFTNLTGTIGITQIADDLLTEAKLKAVNTPTDEYCLTYESTVGDFEWQVCGSGGSGITIDTTTITGGTSGRILYNNAGTVGELATLSSFEADLESFLDLPELQGTLTSSQFADNTISGARITLTGEEQGSLMFHNGTDWINLDPDTNGKVLTTHGIGANPTWETASGGTGSIFPRRLAECLLIQNTSSTFTCTGLPNPATVGSACADSGGSNINIVACTTTTSVDSTSGVSYTTNVSVTSYQNILRVRVHTGVNTSQRIFVGLAHASPAGISTSSTANTVPYTAIMYDTGGASPTANAQCCTSDGSNGANTASCLDMGVAVASSTLYSFEVDFSNTASLECCIDSTCVNKTDDLPASSAGVAANPWMFITNLSAGATRVFYLAHYNMEQN